MGVSTYYVKITFENVVDEKDEEVAMYRSVITLQQALHQALNRAALRGTFLESELKFVADVVVEEVGRND